MRLDHLLLRGVSVVGAPLFLLSGDFFFLLFLFLSLVCENRLSAVLAGSTLILRGRVNYGFFFLRGLLVGVLDFLTRVIW